MSRSDLDGLDMTCREHRIRELDIVVLPGRMAIEWAGLAKVHSDQLYHRRKRTAGGRWYVSQTLDWMREVKGPGAARRVSKPSLVRRVRTMCRQLVMSWRASRGGHLRTCFRKRLGVQGSTLPTWWDSVTAALQLVSHFGGDALNVALLVPASRRVMLGVLLDTLMEHYSSPGSLAD